MDLQETIIDTGCPQGWCDPDQFSINLVKPWAKTCGTFSHWLPSLFNPSNLPLVSTKLAAQNSSHSRAESKTYS